MQNTKTDINKFYLLPKEKALRAEHIFVYGTLKKRGRFHFALSGTEYVRDIILPGWTMYSINGHYPAIAVADNSLGRIKGELYRLPEDLKIKDQTLLALNRIEGYPYLYSRKIIKTTFNESAILYYMTSEQLNMALFGNKLENMNEHQRKLSTDAYRIYTGEWPIEYNRKE